MPTYAALRLYVDSWRWDGVPFYVRAGKSLKMTATEVIVELKNPPQVVFNEATPSMGNYVRFRLSPQVVIAIGARAKRPGEVMAGHPVELSVVDEGKQGDGRLGSATTSGFSATRWPATQRCSPRQDVVEAAWAIVEPIIDDATAMYVYQPGTWGPPQSDRLVADVGGWNTPRVGAARSAGALTARARS